MSQSQFPIGQRISLPGHFTEPVVVEPVRSLGNGCECRVRLSDGSLEAVARSRGETAQLEEHAGIPETTRLVDPAEVQLLVESARIRLAYAHDRQFAVSLSGIRTLPHQIEAVDQQQLSNPWQRSNQVIASARLRQAGRRPRAYLAASLEPGQPTSRTAAAGCSCLPSTATR